MEMDSPPPCPPTVTTRRNPHRNSRPTPRGAPSSPLLPRDIFPTDPPPSVPKIVARDTGPAPGANATTLMENIKLYLRVRPTMVEKKCRDASHAKNVWPKNQKSKGCAMPRNNRTSEICVHVNEDLRSVTVSAPQALQEAKRSKSEVYEGFSHVFAPNASQSDVYEIMVKSVVDDFIKGKSGMLAAMGASGSGKTHTVFGCARDPGIISRALCHIFGDNDSAEPQLSRVLCISMWEIASEKGKLEKIIDLLRDGQQQHSLLKGVKEVVVHDAQQAESVIAQGMLKRATATTKSNSQSSRSQCIINIRCGSKSEDKANSTTLTVVDLAGSEREKKTGNLGARLLESNFINNTSMVFGLCLRSLLEHQKNPNKPLPKHYKNSLLTRYLQDYLEGKKKMTLILTVKSGVEDYVDTSFLLKQASPFMQLKFETIEDQPNLNCRKRQNDDWLIAIQQKKIKLDKNVLSKVDVPLTTTESRRKGNKMVTKETFEKELKDDHDQQIKGLSGKHSKAAVHDQSSEIFGPASLEEPSSKRFFQNSDAKKDREFKITLGLSKAFWKVLKEFKMKLQELEIENFHLRDCSAKEYDARRELQNKLFAEQLLRADLENELKELKLCCKYHQEKPSDVLNIPSTSAPSNHPSSERAEYLDEAHSGFSTLQLGALKRSEGGKDDAVNMAGHDVTITDDGIELIQSTYEPGKSIETGISQHNQPSECFDSSDSSDSYIDSAKKNMNSGGEPVDQVTYSSVCTNGDCLILDGESELASESSNLVTSVTMEGPKDQTSSSEESMQRECSQSGDYDSQLEDPSFSMVVHSDAANSSCELHSDEDKFLITDKRHLHPPVAALSIDGCNAEYTLKSVPRRFQLPPATLHPEDENDAEIASALVPNKKPIPPPDSHHKDKPRRRLLPAASMLLRDIAIFDVKDADEKPKANRRRERTTMGDEENYTQSGRTLPLFNLLKKLQL